MTNAGLETLTVEQLVARFAEIGVAQDNAEDDNEEYARLFRQMETVRAALKSRPGDQRRALLALFDHKNMQVRLMAAKTTLAVVPKEARQMVEFNCCFELVPASRRRRYVPYDARSRDVCARLIIVLPALATAGQGGDLECHCRVVRAGVPPLIFPIIRHAYETQSAGRLRRPVRRRHGHCCARWVLRGRTQGRCGVDRMFRLCRNRPAGTGRRAGAAALTSIRKKSAEKLKPEE